ncbi:hypothetical protein [Leifsonia soli]|uniref:Uncharacterized protein n=1 Tax=Leifsonia soli TaxID=582665 RepID=A0A852T2Z4_9MICO|nr:hypothetical protein [Leifsonia soli]NYD75245.1 hypothetical protein [Leifsonia soli]
MKRRSRDWALEYQRARGEPLSAEQADYLVESGEFTRESLESAQAAIARGELAEAERATRQAGIDASLIVEAVARRLGISVAQVDKRREDGELFAFVFAGDTLYPTWQFTDDPRHPVLSGLSCVLRAIPEDWHPAGVLAFMTTPKSSLQVSDKQLSPEQWLLRGGDPRAVTAILESFLMS